MTLPCVVAVPARLESSRLPGKVLADIGGKPMLQRVLEQCDQATAPAAVVLCTDSQELAERARQWGFEALLTSPACESGSERIASVAELDARLADAGRPVMLDFYADWCVSCKEMERYTFSNAQVGDRLSGMRLLQVDVTGNTAEHKALLKRFKLFGPPGIIFFDARGREIPGLRVVGFQSAEKFGKTLDMALR